jgi:predicted nucleic acid-binding protein
MRDVARPRAIFVALLPGSLVVVPAQALGELHRVLVGKMVHAPAEAKPAILSWADAFDVADSTFEALRSRCITECRSGTH